MKQEEPNKEQLRQVLYLYPVPLTNRKRNIPSLTSDSTRILSIFIWCATKKKRAVPINFCQKSPCFSIQGTRAVTAHQALWLWHLLSHSSAFSSWHQEQSCSSAGSPLLPALHHCFLHSPELHSPLPTNPCPYLASALAWLPLCKIF